MELPGMDLAKQATALVKPMTSEAAGLKETQKNVDAVATPKTAPIASPVPETKSAPVDRINPKARYGMKPGEKRIDTTEYQKQLGSFKDGTDYVPKTGTYQLHEGEKVVPKDKNMENMKDKMMASLGGDKKPKKEIKEMVHSKSTNGKHIVVHRHHAPAHHPDETHVLENMAALKAHMEDHAGTPNEGEAPEPEQGAQAPAQMTAAPSAPEPEPGAGQ